MADDGEITKGDVQRAYAKMRAAYERDPVKYAALKRLVENPPPADYDPQRDPPYIPDEGDAPAG